MNKIKKMKRWTLVGVSLGVLLAPSFLSSLSFVTPSLVHADETKDKDKNKDKEKKKDTGEKRTDNNASGKNLVDSPLTSALLANGLSNEDYTGLDTNYLYRGYPDIADYSRMYYGNIMGDNISSNGAIVFNIGSWSEGLATMFPKVDSVKNVSTNVSPSDIRSSMHFIEA